MQGDTLTISAINSNAASVGSEATVQSDGSFVYQPLTGVSRILRCASIGAPASRTSRISERNLELLQFPA